MHHLATCQDIVSSFRQALRWETVSETVIQLHPPLKLTAQENAVFQVQMSPNRAVQSISRCNRQPKQQFQMSSPSKHGIRIS